MEDIVLEPPKRVAVGAFIHVNASFQDMIEFIELDSVQEHEGRDNDKDSNTIHSDELESLHRAFL
jgi:hypothetical protein